MRRWKHALVVLAAGAVVLLVLVVVVRRYFLGERLVGDAWRLSADRPRPVHRPPASDETYAACLGPLLDAAPAEGAFAFAAPEDVRDEITRIIEGTADVGTLRPESRADFDRIAPWVDRALRCTAGTRVGDAPGMGPFADWNHPRQNKAHVPPNLASRVGAVQMWNALSAGAPDSALRTCADVLVLERDATHSGLVGAMLAASAVRRIMPACARAVDAAPAAAKRQFLAEAAAIRIGLLSFSDVVEIEGVEMQLVGWGGYLSASQRARLPANARELATAHPGNELAGASALAWYLSWPSFVQRNAALARASASPTRDVDVAAVDQHKSLFEWFLEHGSPKSSFASFMRRYDDVSRALTLLESAALIDLGEAAKAPMTSTKASGVMRLSLTWADGTATSVEVHPDTMAAQ